MPPSWLVMAWQIQVVVVVDDVVVVGIGNDPVSMAVDHHPMTWQGLVDVVDK